MAAIPNPVKPSTIAKIEEAVQLAERAKSPYPFRGHLGASSIGRWCERELWYAFRGVKRVEFSGRLLRLFQRGHEEEPSLIRYLQMAGVTYHEHDPATGKQFQFADVGGHFGGSCDGCGIGFAEAPKTWHVGEFKTSSKKYFTPMTKKGVEEAKPEHFAQMQVYMHLSGTTNETRLLRAYYLMVCKDNDELYSERIKYCNSFALSMIEKARRIITAPAPLAKGSDKPDFFKCRFCDYSDVCHESTLPLVHCRTCAHATPDVTQDRKSSAGGGPWLCSLHENADLSSDDQLAACCDHRFIPPLVTFATVVDASNDDNWIEYELPDGRRFKNGDQCNGGFSSDQIREAGANVIELASSTEAVLRRAFDARFDQDREPFSV